jgi:hypothetical protein
MIRKAGGETPAFVFFTICLAYAAELFRATG